MAAFPTLKTGAVVQYPAERQITFSTQVVAFIDGSEQRFRDYRAAVHRWVIRLDQLDDSELEAVAGFFQQTNPASPFSFTDPWDGTVYPSCAIEGNEFKGEFLANARARTQLTIRENRT